MVLYGVGYTLQEIGDRVAEAHCVARASCHNWSGFSRILLVVFIDYIHRGDVPRVGDLGIYYSAHVAMLSTCVPHLSPCKRVAVDGLLNLNQLLPVD